MSLIAISQRVAVDPQSGERRDCLDQRWNDFLKHCGFAPLPLPNDVSATRKLLDEIPVSGIVLTGGNDLTAYGGDAPERDETEMFLIERAMRSGLPLLGVCRGMQTIQHHFRVPLQRLDGHVTTWQTISIEGAPADVNSFHHWGAKETRPPLEVWAVAADGVIKATRHRGERVMGIMWHPERLDPFMERDVDLFRQFLGDR